jgi:D-alanyl-D-alanine dipeptidase
MDGLTRWLTLALFLVHSLAVSSPARGAEAGASLDCLRSQLALLLQYGERPITEEPPRYTQAQLRQIKSASEQVRLSDSPGLRLEPHYYRARLPGAQAQMTARRAVAERLGRAASQLPPGFELVILDAFRSQETQLALFNQVHNQLRTTHPDWTPQKLLKETLQYVAHPGEHAEYRVAPHNSGGAVDVALAYRGKLLDFGTPFDDPSSLSATAYFESAQNRVQSGPSEQVHWEAIQRNRRILYHLMIENGFTNYSGEWWHYDLGTILWKEKTGITWEWDSMELAPSGSISNP